MNYHNCGLGLGRVQGVELMVWVKDKLDDMDVSLEKEAGVQNGDHHGLIYGQTNWHPSLSWVTNESSRYCLSIYTSNSDLGLMVL